jgi:hypothetical protein
LILGTSTGEGNIRFGNSRAKFCCVVKMLIYINIEQRQHRLGRPQKHERTGNIAAFAAVIPPAAGGIAGALERAWRHREMRCDSGTGACCRRGVGAGLGLRGTAKGPGARDRRTGHAFALFIDNEN